MAFRRVVHEWGGVVAAPGGAGGCQPAGAAVRGLQRSAGSPLRKRRQGGRRVGPVVTGLGLGHGYQSPKVQTGPQLERRQS